MRAIESMVERAAPTDLSVLITGESGVGKEVIARRIFECSQRNQQPFIKINSAAIPESLVESELFGHARGAFTDAVNQKEGRVHLAHHGTLFFDEIAELSLESQSKLLQILQDQEYTPLGTNAAVHVDIRILAATNKELGKEVEAGSFRQDLFYRLDVVHIRVPPLRDRVEDLPALIEHFLERYTSQLAPSRAPYLSGQQIELMTLYHWPGNVRELENFVKNLILLGDGSSAFNALKRQIGNGNQGEQERKLSLIEMARLAEAQAERKVIERVLDQTGWNRKKTAKLLQISYRSLLSKIKKLEIG